MSKSPIRFTKSLSGRMLLWGILPTAAVLTGLVVFVSLSLFNAVRRERENALRKLADHAATEIERNNTRAVLTVQVMAQAQESGMFGDRVASSDYARRVLVEMPEFTAAYFGYEPNADQDDAAFRDSPAGVEIRDGLGPSGRFIPYWHRDKNDMTEVALEPLVNMDTSLYYDGSKQRYQKSSDATPMVTEPHEYEGKMIVEQTYPIVIDGQFKGIAGVDRALVDILDYLDSIKNRESVNLFLISRTGRFVATTIEGGQGLKTQPFQNTPYAELFGKLTAARRDHPQMLAPDPSDGKLYYFVCADVPTGDWTLVLREPGTEVMGPIRNMFFSVLAAICVVLAFVTINGFMITSKTAARIREAVHIADDLAHGDISGRHESGNIAADEVGLLQVSFDRLIASYQEIQEVASAIAHGDFSRPLAPRGDKDALAHAINEMAEKRQRAEAALRQTAEDLTEATKAAEKANRTKSEFLSHMSHELRTPLNGILGYAQILQRSPTASKDQKQSLAAIISCGEHLLSLINDVLDLSKIESGRLEVDAQPCDLRALIPSVGDVVRERANSRGLDFRIDIAPEVPRGIVSDAAKLRQILINLLGNAVKFTDNGSVTLRVSVSSNKGLLFDVADTGVGIDPADIDGIFDAFKQIEAGKGAGGTGLGLAITKRLVSAMGGKIAVRSVIGQGSVFSVRLPLVVADDNDLALIESTDSLQGEPIFFASGASASILVADESETNRNLLESMLSEAGFHVLSAVDGQDALDQLRTDRDIDLVLMDIRMPRLDGFETLKRIRSDDSLRSVKVIAVTASVFPEFRKQTIDAGFDDFVGKPFRVDELMKKLAKHLDLTYGTAKDESATAAAFAGGDSIVLPDAVPAEVITRFRNALRIKNLTAIKALSAELIENPETKKTGERMKDLAATFDFKQLTELLEELERTSE